MYAQEAISLRDSSKRGETAIALCCTHYPYVKNAFEQAFTSLLGQPVTIIDPNAAMAASLFEGADCAQSAATSSSVEVVSRARIAPADVAAIANLLKAESSATAAALQSYVYDTTLFEYRP
jgi:glutamate racemase